MKKILLTVYSMLFCSVLLRAQTVRDLFIESDVAIYWLGIDFSHIQLIGDFDGRSPVEIRDRYFPSWNNLIMDEWQKYNINEMLRKENIQSDLDMITKVNANTPVNTLKTDEALIITSEQINDYVQKYDLSGKEGIGILFMAECFNKRKTRAAMHFVTINMQTKEVLLQERLTGKPEGFGLRNFWAGAIYDIISLIRYDSYLRWKAKYKKLKS